MEAYKYVYRDKQTGKYMSSNNNIYKKKKTVIDYFHYGVTVQVGF